MTPPTEAQLECERLREELSVVNDTLRESEHRNDGLEETIVELAEEREASEQRYNQLASTITLIAKGVPSPAEYAKLMEACETAVECMREGIDDYWITLEDYHEDIAVALPVIESAIAAFGPPFVTRAPGDPTQEPDDES